MARFKLSTVLPEITKYIGIPYYVNSARNSLQQEAVLVGKGTAHEIALKTIEYANQDKVDLRQLSPPQIYAFQKKHRLGIDCSGLAFHLLELLYPQIGNTLVGSDNRRGVRRLSANLLTSFPNAVPIPPDAQPQLGDLIRFDSGKHVLFIVEADKKHIHYLHSSQRTKIRGVHFGQITLASPHLDLSHQQWSDVLSNGKPYHSLFSTSTGDGIFRLQYK